MQRTGNVENDVKLLGQISVILNEHAGGSDVVELTVVGHGLRVELEWPACQVQWDRQLDRQLAQLLGAEGVRVEAAEDRERAIVP
jgi:hypothetical protein